MTPERPAVAGRRRVLLRALRAVATLVAITLLVAVMIDGVRSVDVSDISWRATALAALCSLLTWILFAASWSTLTLGVPKGAVTDWFATQIYRYLPGGVWAPIARGGTLAGTITRRASVVALEAVILVSSAVAVASVAVVGRWPTAALGVVILAAPAIAGRVVPTISDMPLPHIVKAQLLAMTGWVLFAIAGAASQAAVGSDLGASDFAGVGGVSVASWAAGFIVVVAPSGAGVREVTYISSVTPFVDDGLASAGVTLHRLLGVVAELVAFIAATALRRRSLPTGDPTSETGESSAVSPRNESR